MNRTLCLIALLLLAPSATLAATFYKWIDDSGVTQYTLRAPLNKPYEKVNTTTGRSEASEANTSENTPEVNDTDADRIKDFEVITPDPAVCQQARERLDALNSYTRIRYQDKDGTYKYMNNQEKDKEKQMAQEVIDAHCN